MKNQEISISLHDVTLKGNLQIPKNAIGLVIFSHGSGSSRFSSRNLFVAEKLRQKGLGTFLFDLLTQQEDQVYGNRFDIDLLTKRLIQTTDWLLKETIPRDLPIGYFGASTGAASALKATAYFGNTISAVVSRGGRPDLAINELPLVVSPTLLIIGGKDETVIDLNRKAYEMLNCTKELKIIPDASHLFEEPGKLIIVSELAAEWFLKHFTP